MDIDGAINKAALPPHPSGTSAVAEDGRRGKCGASEYLFLSSLACLSFENLLPFLISFITIIVVLYVHVYMYILRVGVGNVSYGFIFVPCLIMTMEII